MMRFALAAIGLVLTASAASAQSPYRGPAELEHWAAECTNAQGEFEFADVERSCTRIIRSDIATSGARAFAYRQRGLAHFQHGDEARALEDFNSAIRYNPHFTEGFITRAAFYEGRGEYDLGAADYNEVLRIEPEFGPAYNARCWLRTLGGTDLLGAREDCDRAIALGVGAAAYDSRGLLNLKEGKFDLALADYNTAVTSGSAAHSLYGRGVAALRLGQTETGQADIAAATAADQQLPDTYRRYGIAP